MIAGLLAEGGQREDGQAENRNAEWFRAHSLCSAADIVEAAARPAPAGVNATRRTAGAT